MINVLMIDEVSSIKEFTEFWIQKVVHRLI